MEVAVFIVLFFAWAVVDEFAPHLLGRWFSRLTAPALYLFKKLKQAWARDRLAVAGVGSAVVAFLLWAWPYEFGLFYGYLFFSTERLPAVAAFLALSFILLLLRRR